MLRIDDKEMLSDNLMKMDWRGRLKRGSQWEAGYHGSENGQGDHTAAVAAAKSLQSCLTLCNPIDGSPPGSSVHGIFQARVLEWGVIAFSKEVS